jgi:hypothetical protein
MNVEQQSFNEIKFSNTLSIYKTNINNIDNHNLIKDLEYNCEVSKNTTYGNENNPGTQSDIYLLSKNVNLLRDTIISKFIKFFNLNENYLLFKQDWVFISDKNNIYSIYHKHDAGPNLRFVKEKPQWSLTYYVSVPDFDNKLFFKENENEYSVSPNVGDLILFSSSIMHRPEVNNTSLVKRVVYGMNIAILDRNKEYNKKIKSLV